MDSYEYKFKRDLLETLKKIAKEIEKIRKSIVLVGKENKNDD